MSVYDITEKKISLSNVICSFDFKTVFLDVSENDTYHTCAIGGRTYQLKNIVCAMKSSHKKHIENEF